jgi:hypothetical protein
MMGKLVLVVGIDRLPKLPIKDHQPLINPFKITVTFVQLPS